MGARFGGDVVTQRGRTSGAPRQHRRTESLPTIDGKEDANITTSCTRQHVVSCRPPPSASSRTAPILVPLSANMDSTAACCGRGRRGEQIPAASPPPTSRNPKRESQTAAGGLGAEGQRGKVGVVSMGSKCRVMIISKAASLPTAARSSQRLTESSKRSRKRRASDSSEASSLPAAYAARVG